MPEARPAPPEWEYREYTVKLNIDAARFPSLQAARDYVERSVRLTLRRASQYGWEAGGPIDWDALWADGRIKVRSGWYESVTIKLKRPPPL